MTQRLEIGGNNPPGMIEAINDTASDLNEWMKENPVIQSEEAAREAKLLLDRARLCVKDMEDERDGKVRPLNEQVKKINETYRGPRELMEVVGRELGNRLAAFIRSEEKKREEAAQEAQKRAAEAERIAREAERLEREAIGSADSGELGVDVKAAVVAADDSFKDFQRAAREAALAERETRVKVGGGFGRALGLRTQKTLLVLDCVKAVTELGMTGPIEEAVIKSARAFHKLHRRYPQGVVVDEERGL